MKILLAADGSACTEAAARHVVTHLEWFVARPEVHVLHVSTPLPARVASEVGTLSGREVLADYHRLESESALEGASTVFRDAGVPCKASWTVGDVAAELDRYVRRHGIDLVVMGSHGHGALAGMVLGSVTTKCLATLEAPILVVRRPPANAARGLEKAAA
jgi:nucleotide-binding universal stress UspA family protein